MALPDLETRAPTTTWANLDSFDWIDFARGRATIVPAEYSGVLFVSGCTERENCVKSAEKLFARQNVS